MKKKEQPRNHSRITPSDKAKDTNLFTQLQFPWYNEPLNPHISHQQDKVTDSTQSVKELPLNFIGRGEVRGSEFTQIKSSIRGYLYQVKI